VENVRALGEREVQVIKRVSAGGCAIIGQRVEKQIEKGSNEKRVTKIRERMGVHLSIHVALIEY